jgi:hypothetical protein
MSVSVPFPAIKPYSRSYNPGTFPQTEFVSLNGSTSVIRFGNQRVNSSLKLEFRYISAEEATEIIENYENVNGNWNWVTFQDTNATAGIPNNTGLKGYIREYDTGLKWRYTRPPEISASADGPVGCAGACNVSCEFTAFFDGD